ncbi:hypothetical protein F4678DRAFT_469840 [Xylaria arbuscula]|nr:hypothetical protein F4678DRAFT_469840 [Xylaria arbuscula]
MTYGWTLYDGTYDPVPQDKRRKRDVPYPSFVPHVFRSRAGLSNLQLSHNAPISLCSIDVAVSHVWKCMPGNARRYLHIPPPNGPALWSDNEKAVAAMYKKIDNEIYHVPLAEDPDKSEYRGYADMKRRPWIVWPLWVEDRWGSGWVTVISYSENTDETQYLYNQLISYSIIDPRRSPDADGNGRHGPVRDRIERIQNQLLGFYGKAGIDTSAAEYKEVLCSPMPFDEVTSGERCFAVVKELVNQIIDWSTSGRNFCKVGTIKNMQKWVNPFQQRVELTGINAWILMASLEYDARITVEKMLTNTITEVAADGVKKYLRPYDLAGPFQEPPVSAPDYFLPPEEIYKPKSDEQLVDE